MKTILHVEQAIAVYHNTPEQLQETIGFLRGKLTVAVTRVLSIHGGPVTVVSREDEIHITQAGKPGRKSRTIAANQRQYQHE